MTVKEAAIVYIKSGISVIPITETKNPAIKEWEPYQKAPMELSLAIEAFSRAYGLGFITGKVNGVEVIDIDCKYDLSNTLYEDFTNAVKKADLALFTSLVIAKTKNNGYHLFYKSNAISGNEKLANRETATEEREKSYQKALLKAPTVKQVIEGRLTAEQYAAKVSQNDKVRVLIETRGEGGYVAAYPTPGYEFLQGKILSIKEITKEQRSLLFDIAKSFNKIRELPKKESPKTEKQPDSDHNIPGYDNNGLTPWDDYNQKGGASETLSLLESEGWTEAKREGGRIYVLRPGETDSKTSGNINKDGILYVFTTSSELEANKGYSPFMLYALYKHKSDYSAAASQLYKDGFGERKKKQEKEKNTNAITPTEITTETISFEIITTSGEALTLSPGRYSPADFAEAKEVYLIADIVKDVYNVKRVLTDLHVVTAARIYVKANPVDFRGYEFLLDEIQNRYWKIEQTEKRDLLPEETDRYQEEIVKVGGLLKSHPLDLPHYEKTITGLLGIPEKTVKAILKQLHSLQAKQEKIEALAELNKKINQKIGADDADEAVKIIEQSIVNIKLKDKEAEFNELLKPITREEVERELSGKKEGIHSGIVMVHDRRGEEIIFPSGALTIIAAPSHHGKTTLLINTALHDLANMKGTIHFFSYEESSVAIIRNALNIYADLQLVNPGKSNRQTIEGFLANKENWQQWVSTEGKSTKDDEGNPKESNLSKFTKKSDDFFKNYIENGKIKIHYKDFSAEELIAAIEYLVEIDNPKAFYIDYIQLLNSDKSKGKARHDELKVITQYLRDISVRHDLPIILAAQFNNTVTNPTKISMTAIGEGGDISRSANTILAMWGLRLSDKLNDNEMRTNAFDHASKEERGELNNHKHKLFSIGKRTYIKVLKHRLQSHLVGQENTFEINPSTDKINTIKPVGIPTGVGDNDGFGYNQQNDQSVVSYTHKETPINNPDFDF